MAVKLELYRVFHEVARMGNISAAAQNLFISQSAVSQSIKVLEKKLGITLFIRSTKRVQLTPEGETLLRHVEPAINLIARGEAQIMEAGTLGGGQLRIVHLTMGAAGRMEHAGLGVGHMGDDGGEF